MKNVGAWERKNAYLCIMEVTTLKNNHTLSFDQVYLDCFERLCYHAFCIVGDEEDAKDIVNGVFTFVYERWESCASKPISVYLLTLVHNASVDFCRRKQAHRRYKQYVLAHDSEVELRTDYEERVQRVIAEIDNMPEQMRSVFVNCYLRGMKHQDVALEMGLSVNTIKTNIYRGLKMLRKRLSEEEFLLLFVFSSQLL